MSDSRTEEAQTVNGHRVVYRSHRFVCTRCEVRRLNMMQFTTRECPGPREDERQSMTDDHTPETEHVRETYAAMRARVPQRDLQSARDEFDRWLSEQREEARAEERERWVGRLAELCDDDWLRRRDRAAELPGVKGHRWERKAASAWETAARQVRAALNDLADYEAEYVNQHAAYRAWMLAGRDVGAEACGHPNHGAADHDCAPFLATKDGCHDE